MAPMEYDGGDGSWGLGLAWNPGHRSGSVLGLAGLVLVLWGFVWSVCLLGLYTAWVARQLRHPSLTPWFRRTRYASRPRSRLASLPADAVPGVTIIRPLRGLDPNLYYNLQSTFQLEYPKYELIFAIQREDDQAREVVERLMGENPEVDAKVVVSTESIGVNPKINNIHRPVEQARYDILWVLDATVSVLSSTLARSVEALISSEKVAGDYTDVARGSKTGDVDTAAMPGDVGVVHHVPFAFIPQKSFGSRLEQAYLNTTHAKMYLAINATAVDSCVVGKSNLYRRSSVRQLQTPAPSLKALSAPLTGLPGFSPFLAEDNMIASAIMHQLKLKHAMTPDLALDCLGPLTLSAYIARRVRWIRVRKRMTLAATLVEPLTESLLLGILASWAAHTLFGFPGWLFFALHELAWITTDLAVLRALKGEGLERDERASFLVAWACREALALPIWLKAMVGSTVIWRGVTYRIVASGEAIKVSDHD